VAHRIDFYPTDTRLWLMLNKILKKVLDKAGEEETDIDDGGGEFDFDAWKKITYWWSKTFFSWPTGKVDPNIGMLKDSSESWDGF